MKNIILLCFLIQMGFNGFAQTISTNNLNSLNNYILLINNRTEDLTNALKCLYPFNETVKKYQLKPGIEQYFSFKCTWQPSYYELNEIRSERNTIPLAQKEILNKETDLFVDIHDSLLKEFQAIEIYVRLQDYKKDKFGKIDSYLENIERLFSFYNSQKEELEQAVFKVYSNLQKNNPSNHYFRASNQMLDIISKETELLHSWYYVLNAEESAGLLPLDAIKKYVNETDRNTLLDKSFKLNYPSNSHYATVISEETGSMQGVKRNIIDGYTSLARKNNLHSNKAYFDILNYLNNSLISFYNAFVKSLRGTGNNLLLQPIVAPFFVVNDVQAPLKVSINKFIEKQYPQFSVKKQPNPITANESDALNKYVDFINDEIRGTLDIPLQLLGYSNTAKRMIDDIEKLKKGHIDFLRNDYYKIPVSVYESAINNSRFLPIEVREPLNTQLKDLMTIVQEREAIIDKLINYSSTYEFRKDTFTSFFEMEQRLAFLLDAFDRCKEHLHSDLLQVYNSFPLNDKKNSWLVSSTALGKTISLEKAALIKVKWFAQGNLDSIPGSTDIDRSIREQISSEYQNMDGLEKLGRNNGLCPYTPYDYIADYGFTFVKKINEIKTNFGQKKDSVRIYQDYLYLYNSTIDDYNDFVDLATDRHYDFKQKNVNALFLLKNVKQPLYYKLNSQVKSSKTNPPEKVGKAEEPVDSLFTSMDGYAINHIVLLLDISGSMADKNKLPLLQASMKKLLNILRDSDMVSIVTYSGEAKVVLSPTSAKDKVVIESLSNLKSVGCTDFNKGFDLASKVAKNGFISNGNNRILIATDGQFLVSGKSYKMVEKLAEKGIETTVFGYGIKNMPANLESLVRFGNGQSEIITDKNSDYKLVLQFKSKRK